MDSSYGKGIGPSLALILLVIAGVLMMLGAGIYASTHRERKDYTMSAGQIEKVEVRIGYTVNAGNYESVRVDLGVTRFMAEGESTTDVMTAMREQLRKEVQKAAKEELQAMKGGKRG